MQVNIHNNKGEDTGRTAELSDAVFAATVSEHSIYLDVKQYLANQRQGTHKSKEKWEISGSTRKLKKQKGTGGARAGSIKSPLLVGGGRVFGPKPRDYSFKLNKKVKALARKSALSAIAAKNQIKVVEDFEFSEIKTGQYASFLKNLSIDGKKSLLILPAVSKNIVLSSRNIPKTKVSLATNMNTYDILKYENIVLFESSIPLIENSFSAKS